MSEGTATSTEKVGTDVSVEDIGPAAKRLTITVTPESITEKMEEAMGTLSAETTLPGFRKGRAPRQLLERRFGTALKTETKNQLVAEAYSAAIEEHGLKPVGEPEPVDKLDDLELVAGKPLTFKVDVEVCPEFELPSFDGVEVKKPVLDITEELVKSELERYQKQLGEVHRLSDGFEEGDRLVGQASATRKGEDEPFFTHDQVVVVYPGNEDGGRGQLLGLLVDGLAGMLKGKKLTDSIRIETTGPEAHEREDIRGKELVIDFEIHQAERVEPASTEKVIETLGLGTEEILNEQIKLALEQRRDEEQAEAMRQQIREHLLDTVQCELPEKLSERQVARTLEQHRLQLLYQGMTPEDVETKLAEMRADSATSTKNRLKLFFILQQLGDHYGVEVSQQEINGRVAMMAARRGARPEKMMQELSQSGRLGEVATQIRESKALDRVLHDVKKTEITAEQWREIVAGTRSTGSAGTRKKTATTSKKKTTSKKTTTKKKTTKKTTAQK
jgi:trigger factor